ncbi:MAG: family 78 glycoside hydrolase catalytic domain, partial [Chloroflexia bacterium]|nr:family 78 glycoside hydrolase catalytic domain [Chloroflexia bacterium]
SYLRTEYLENPLGIDVVRPRLSWIVTSDQRNQVQGAYQILVASDSGTLDADSGDLWDTGRVESRDTFHIVYAGAPLEARQPVWWKVRYWNGDGVSSAWSQTATWELGLLKLVAWQGAWIEQPGLAPDTSIPEAAELDALLPASLFRRTFTVDREVTRARLYATARGVYEPRLNGARVGDQVLAPGWTDYNRRIQVQTFDLTEAIQLGENVLGAEVGTGWYAGYVGWKHSCRHYGATPQLLMQLHLDYADGTSEVIASDADWNASTGAVRYSDFIMGEYRDARLEQPGWDAAGFSAKGWTPVRVSNINAVPLVADCSPPVRALEEIEPVSITEVQPGVHIVDLGQNIAGWARLRAAGDAGTRITLRFAEILNPDGSLYITNLRSARATDTYILRGGGVEEVFEPLFSWHGFRYVEVTGYPGPLDGSAIVGRFVGSDTTPAGTFECSDPLVNQLQRNIGWGQRGNFLSVPTDCPQRDERLGWLGDAQVFIGTATGNMDVASFFTKWMRDVTDGQSPDGAFPDVAPRAVDLAGGAPAWADCGVIVPWTMWKTYGDTGIIDEHWSAMERWMDWLERENPDHLWRHDRGKDFGDWLSIGADTPKELIGTAYWAYDARLMAEMADATGRPSDAARYRERFDAVAAAFRTAYMRDDGSIEGDTQTVYCLALHFGLLEEHQRARAAELLVADIASKDGHLSTGFVGVSYLCHVLTNHGYPDVAYQLLHNETFPSWKYSILHGATTIWERWDGWTEDGGFQDPGMNSFNHYSLGSVGEWLRKSVAGIDVTPGSVGYRNIRIQPAIDDSLTWAEGTYDSMCGPIRSRWERDGDTLRLNVTIPANAEAEIVLPLRTHREVLEDGSAVHAELQDGLARLTVGSGDWTFTVR